MRNAAPLTTLERAKLDAIAASLHGGLLMLLAWLAENLSFLGAGLRSELKHKLREAARDAERIIFLHAVWRLRFFKPTHRALNPPPRGFRSTHTRARSHRRLCHLARLRHGSLSERARRIAALLANPEAVIANAVRRLRRGRHGSVFKVAAPFSESLCHRARRAIAASADTS